MIPLAGPLLDAVLAAPERIEPRLVLADWLSERGDPRGELIALQCLPEPTEIQRRRVQALLRQHGVAWLGHPLASIADERTVRFAQGFLYSCSLRRSPQRLQSELKPTSEHSLVRRLDVVRDFVPDEAPLVHVLPLFRGLASLHGANAEELAAVLAQPPPLVEIGLVDLDRDGIQALLSSDLPELRYLSLEARNRVGMVETLLDRHPTVRRLRVGRGELGAWREALASRGLEALEIRVPAWMMALSGEGLRHLDVWPVPELVDDPITPLVRELRALPVRGLDYIHVRGGRPPGQENVRRLKRAAKGAPLRLPPGWRGR